ncbi:arginase family protein [Rhizobium sp. AN80A]|uniref:arginase family protein n=1 Tax=Rhizobium sp. AN80A TaxID=3040673 RepID=UPI0024B3A4FD|nr:arginase family protein [Rhizobium sp. AN80A]
MQILRALHGINLVGCDVVEANPLYDGPGQITALMAATVMAELMALLASQRAQAKG